MSKKGFATIVVFAVIAVVIAIGGSFGLYYLNHLSKPGIEKVVPTSPPPNTASPTSLSTTTPTSPVDTSTSSATLTAGWKTFTDEGFGIEFRYPPAWNVVKRGAKIILNNSSEIVAIFSLADRDVGYYENGVYHLTCIEGEDTQCSKIPTDGGSSWIIQYPQPSWAYVGELRIDESVSVNFINADPETEYFITFKRVLSTFKINTSISTEELSKRARDGQRVTELDSLNSALALYVTSVPNYPRLVFCPADTVFKSTDGNRTLSEGMGGWLPVPFVNIPGGSPLAILPIDPVNNATFHYSVACDPVNLTWEINAALESDYYNNVKKSAKADRGDNPNVYEIGTAPGLTLMH